MKEEKRVTQEEGRFLVQTYYTEATDKQANIITKTWNTNDGVEYDDNTYANMEDWLYISDKNGFSLEEMLGE